MPASDSFMVTKEKGAALIWCGYFIALIKQTMQPFCFLIYFILTPASLPLLPANTISVKSAQLILCPQPLLQLVSNPSFSHVFSSQPEFCLNKEYGAAFCCWPCPSRALALAPSHCKALQVIQYTSEADFPSPTHLPPGLFPSAEGYMFGNVLISAL